MLHMKINLMVNAVDNLPELEDKSLLLKTPHTLDKGHREVQV